MDIIKKESLEREVPGVFDFEVCLYHSCCPDGIGAAWCIWRQHYSYDKQQPFIVHGVKYSDKYPDDIKDKNVVIVDFSYKREIIKEMCKLAKYVFILDHHDTAQRELEGLDKELPNFSFIFDMNRSGVQITWDWCYPDEPRPWFVEVIADRDLWKWEYPNSKEIGKALYQFGWYTFEKLEELYEDILDGPTERDRSLYSQDNFIKQGQMLLHLEKKDISYSVSKSILCEFEGYKVRLASCSPLIRSEVGSALCDIGDCDFSSTWRYDFATDQWWISLRGSKECEIPLNVLCEKYSGGGHPRACGFAIHGPYSKEIIEASEEKKKKLASGNLHDYFRVVSNT